jgi:hypothetical protein
MQVTRLCCGDVFHDSHSALPFKPARWVETVELDSSGTQPIKQRTRTTGAERLAFRLTMNRLTPS